MRVTDAFCTLLYSQLLVFGSLQIHAKTVDLHFETCHGGTQTLAEIPRNKKKRPSDHYDFHIMAERSQGMNSLYCHSEIKLPFR